MPKDLTHDDLEFLDGSMNPSEDQMACLVRMARKYLVLKERVKEHNSRYERQCLGRGSLADAPEPYCWTRRQVDLTCPQCPRKNIIPLEGL